MGHIQEASMEAVTMTVRREKPEWVIHTKAARKMIEAFPDMFTQHQKNLFFSRREMSAIISIVDLAKNAKKCKELNSIDYLCSPVKTLEGWFRVTYYHVGDVVFATTPGIYEGQKFVGSIFSLSWKLGQIGESRRAAELSGRKKVPMANIRRMRRNAKGKSYFKNNN